MSDNDTSQPTQHDYALRNCVYQSLENYFEQLDGAQVTDLYARILHEVEFPLLKLVMEQSDGNQTRASATLGINRNTLRKKLQHYGLN